ncbi:hypothetical protein [Streptomyces sulphureus]|uniref:hypothetical protein n=1 Tax=Streptomyces sulphureus TaxID=47758 RepID=UPI000D0A9F21|nr:hypothetical protein [Streptomyces sulphureus]
MSTPVPGRVEVDAPPLTPYTYGLLSVAEVVTGDGRWQIGGVEYETDACAQGGRVEGSCPVPVGEPETATLTVEPDAEQQIGVSVYPASDTTPRQVRLVADEALSGPVTVTLSGPEAAPAASVDEDASQGRTVVLALDNTARGGTISRTLEPGASETLTLAEGDWTLNPCGGGFVIPLEETDPDTAVATCTLEQGVTVTAGEDNPDSLTYQVGEEAGGTLAAGETATHVLPAGSYRVAAQAATGEQATGTLTLPGEDSVTLTVTTAAPTSHDKPLAEGLDWVSGGGPFTVYHRAECSTVAFEEAGMRAMARLRLVENREVERAFSLQLAAVEARQPLGEEAVPLPVALGALEADAALHYAGQPTLHAPRWTQPYWSTARLVSQQGPALRTELESPVALGGGYYDDPSAPGDPDPAAGEFWLYATGTVRAHRGQPFAHEVVDPPTNTRMAIAERTYALDHDCYVAAVLVSVAPAGGGE